MAKTHKDLDVWKNGIHLVTEVYKLTSSFPKEEIYGLTSQVRRSAVSIPSNIAEGAARNHVKEYIQFLYIALGSLSELETQFIIAQNLSYIDMQTLESIINNLNQIRAQLVGLLKYLEIK